MHSLHYLIALASLTSAHTIMNRISTSGKQYGQGDGIYMPNINSPQTVVTSNSIACNGPPVSGFKSSNTVIPVTAGTTVTGAWLHELTSTGPDGEADNKVIASSHKGPVLAYMKKVSNAAGAAQSQAAGAGWFKVAAEGLISSNQWAVDKLISNGGIQSVTIPKCIENGDYLLRFEIIALHNAYAQNGAQLYMECAQLRVTGGTGTVKPQTYSIPGIYSASDPGITLNIYNAQGQPYPSSYTIPGPPVLKC